MSMPPADEQRLLESIVSKLDDAANKISAMSVQLTQLTDARILERLVRVEEQVATLQKVPADRRADITSGIAILLFLIDLVARLMPHKG